MEAHKLLVPRPAQPARPSPLEEPAEGAGRRPERGAPGRSPRSSTTEKAHKAWGEPPSPGHPTHPTGAETEVPVASSGVAGGDLGRGRGGGGPQKDTVLSFDDDAPVEEGAAAKGKTRKASWDEGGEIQESVKSKRKGTFVNTKGDYLPWKTKLIYAMPGIATISVTFFIAVYLADFYVSLGVSLSFVGFFTALARAFDVITDPLMGWITDNARTKYGRRRPFIGVGCFFYCLFLVLLMSPPGRIVENSGNNNQAAYWFGVFYTLFYLSDTFTNVPYEALGPELSEDYDQRNQLFLLTKTFNFTGMLLSAGAPSMIAWWLRLEKAEDRYVECSSLLTGTSYDAENSLVSNPFLRRYRPEGDKTGTCLLSESCASKVSGLFCVEQQLADGGLRYLETEIDTLERTCANATLAASTDACVTPAGVSWAMKEAQCFTQNCVHFIQYAMSDLSSYRLAFTITGLCFGIYYILVQLNLVRVLRERPLHPSRVPLAPCVLRALKNIAFRPLLLAWALDGLALSALVPMFPFYVRYVIISDGYKAQQNGVEMSAQVFMGASMFCLLITAVIASPLWLYLSSKLGKYRAWLIYNLVNCVTNVLFLALSEGDNVQTLGIMVLNGIPVGGQFLITSILADVIDYDEFLNGVRNEGSFSVFSTLIPKFVAIPASAIPLAIVNAMGFKQPIDGVAQKQTKSVENFIKFCFILLPFICAFVAFLIKTRFPIRTRECSAAITAGILKHASGKSAADPITGLTVEILKLTQEEEAVVWYYENFDADSLKKIAAEGPDFLIAKMKRLVIADAITLACAVAICGGTFQFINDRKLSIIPVLAVIFSGMFLCVLCLNILRYLDAIALKGLRNDFDHSNLIERLEKSKRSGARAGDVTDVLEDSPLYHVRRGSIFSATLPIVAKYREQRRKGSSDMA